MAAAAVAEDGAAERQRRRRRRRRLEEEGGTPFLTVRLSEYSVRSKPRACAHRRRRHTQTPGRVR